MWVMQHKTDTTRIKFVFQSILYGCDLYLLSKCCTRIYGHSLHLDSQNMNGGLNSYYALTIIIMFLAAYCVVAVESVGRQTPIAFLDRVKDDFTKRYGGGKASAAGASSLNREFGYVLCTAYYI
jgi:hypothetical protein